MPKTPEYVDLIPIELFKGNKEAWGLYNAFHVYCHLTHDICVHDLPDAKSELPLWYRFSKSVIAFFTLSYKREVDKELAGKNREDEKKEFDAQLRQALDADAEHRAKRNLNTFFNLQDWNPGKDAGEN